MSTDLPAPEVRKTHFVHMVCGTRFDHNCETQSSEKEPLKRSRSTLHDQN